jgi:NAD-dependent deacetylase
MIIVGTTAQVYPAAGLLELATQNGATLIDVNLERTNFSRLENYEYLDDTAATSLPALAERVEQLKKTANGELVEDLKHSFTSFPQ